MNIEVDEKELSLIFHGLYRQLGYLKNQDESTFEVETLLYKLKVIKN